MDRNTTAMQSQRMTFTQSFTDEVLECEANQEPPCFLGQFDMPPGLQDDVKKHAISLDFANRVSILNVMPPYTEGDVRGCAGRVLSPLVVEHSHYVRKFMKWDAYMNRKIAHCITARMVVVVCEEMVALQNWLFLTMSMPHTSIPIEEATRIYLEFGCLIMDEFWLCPKAYQQTFRLCTNAAGTSTDEGIDMDSSTRVGHELQTRIGTARGTAAEQQEL